MAETKILDSCIESCTDDKRGDPAEDCDKAHAAGSVSSWKDHVDDKWLTEEVLGLSKNQQKKMLKKKVTQQRRIEKRKEERLRKKERRLKLKEAGLPLPQRSRSKHMKNAEYSAYKIAIDLDFFDLMNPTDLRMILKQVKQCYADNRKVKNPFKFHVTSFCSRYKDLFHSLQPGYINWQLSFHSENYMEVFDKDNIVYLTADSENILETLDDEKVYIIGGLVDHNQQKGLCYEMAKRNGIAHAQLPIGQYVKLNTRKVLTINHVFEILLQYKESQNWRDAFLKVIPKRKGLNELDEEGTDDEGGNDEKTISEQDDSREESTIKNPEYQDSQN